MDRIELDVSEEEAPTPLLRATEELQKLADDSYLHIIHRMAPCRLYNYLEANNFYVETRSGEGGLCEIFICHDSADEIKSHIALLVQNMKPWQQ
ncbi:MAG: hypothetical protein GQ470_04455 [Gammaproteobacteria bacterium]|nr:hypothetical protein [Gammaproteobacteria bacterium]